MNDVENGSFNKDSKRIVDIKLPSCAQFAPNLHPLASRSCANKLCPYVPRFDLKYSKRKSVLWKNTLCLNVLSDVSNLL